MAIEIVEPQVVTAHSVVLDEAFFDEAFRSNIGLTTQLRKLSERITREFKISGICDPLYIANVIAHEVGVGNGSSIFTGETAKADEATILKLLSRLSFAYSCNIPANSPVLLSHLKEALI